MIALAVAAALVLGWIAVQRALWRGTTVDRRRPTQPDWRGGQRLAPGARVPPITGRPPTAPTRRRRGQE